VSPIWKSGLGLAIVGPLIGYGLLAIALGVTALGHRDEAPPDEPSFFLLLTLLLLALLGAYLIGAPAAFAVGATKEAMRRRGCTMPWILLVNLVLGSALSGTAMFVLDMHMLPHPHLDAAPLFGRGMWLTAAAIGAVAAVICTLFPVAARVDGRA
jgi:hypothetical protein